MSSLLKPFGEWPLSKVAYRISITDSSIFPLRTSSSSMLKNNQRRQVASGHSTVAASQSSTSPPPLQSAFEKKKEKECLDIDDILKNFSSREHSIQELLRLIQSLPTTQSELYEVQTNCVKAERIRFESEERIIKKYFNIKADEDSLQNMALTRIVSKILANLQVIYTTMVSNQQSEYAEQLLAQTSNWKEEISKCLLAQPFRFTSLLISVCCFSRSRLATVQAKVREHLLVCKQQCDYTKNANAQLGIGQAGDAATGATCQNQVQGITNESTNSSSNQPTTKELKKIMIPFFRVTYHPPSNLPLTPKSSMNCTVEVDASGKPPKQPALKQTEKAMDFEEINMKTLPPNNQQSTIISFVSSAQQSSVGLPPTPSSSTRYAQPNRKIRIISQTSKLTQLDSNAQSASCCQMKKSAELSSRVTKMSDSIEIPTAAVKQISSQQLLNTSAEAINTTSTTTIGSTPSTQTRLQSFLQTIDQSQKSTGNLVVNATLTPRHDDKRIKGNQPTNKPASNSRKHLHSFYLNPPTPTLETTSSIIIPQKPQKQPLFNSISEEAKRDLSNFFLQSDISYEDTFPHLNQQSELLFNAVGWTENASNTKIQIDRIMASMLRQNANVKMTANNFFMYSKQYQQKALKLAQNRKYKPVEYQGTINTLYCPTDQERIQKMKWVSTQLTQYNKPQTLLANPNTTLNTTTLATQTFEHLKKFKQHQKQIQQLSGLSHRSITIAQRIKSATVAQQVPRNQLSTSAGLLNAKGVSGVISPSQMMNSVQTQHQHFPELGITDYKQKSSKEQLHKLTIQIPDDESLLPQQPVVPATTTCKVSSGQSSCSPSNTDRSPIAQLSASTNTSSFLPSRLLFKSSNCGHNNFNNTRDSKLSSMKAKPPVKPITVSNVLTQSILQKQQHQQVPALITDWQDLQVQFPFRLNTQHKQATQSSSSKHSHYPHQLIGRIASTMSQHHESKEFPIESNQKCFTESQMDRDISPPPQQLLLSSSREARGISSNTRYFTSRNATQIISSSLMEATNLKDRRVHPLVKPMTSSVAIRESKTSSGNS